MEDKEIIGLYFARSERAIEETAGKYGSFCHGIAYHILGSNEDSKECVNDTYYHVWNVIPPNRPSCFRAFLGKSPAIWRSENTAPGMRKNAAAVTLRLHWRSCGRQPPACLRMKH